jgi:hypothetical protein
MANMLDYIQWRGDLDFAQSPFNPVDNIILSQFSYLPLDTIVPGPDEDGEITIGIAAKIFSQRLQKNVSRVKQAILCKDDPALLKAMGSSRRFGDCRVRGYVNIIDTDRGIQFSAICINTGDNSSFVAYRGTDMTLVGWKEDFNMSFNEAVPAQLEAVAYLEKMAKKIRGPLRVGGHSKGGNLAIYAASFCTTKTRARITEVFSNDAPGFHQSLIDSKGFAQIKGRIHSFVPQASVVGMLLEHGSGYKVVRSNQFGLMQHELYSWEVTHNNMIHVDSVTQSSRVVDNILREWIGNLDTAQREQFLEALYTILNSTQAKSLSDLGESWFQAAGRMLKSLNDIDGPTKALIGKTLGELLGSTQRNIYALLTSEQKDEPQNN